MCGHAEVVVDFRTEVGPNSEEYLWKIRKGKRTKRTKIISCFVCLEQMLPYK